MKKRGFTLIELIGVIVLLGVIAVFTVPALTKTLKQTSDKEYEEFKKNIILAAENYFHSETDGIVGFKKFINISTLVEKGYLKKTVNPLTGTDVRDDATVIIYKDNNGVERYDFVDADVTERGYVTDGLILYYDGYTAPVDNTWKDISGNGNDGTIYGTIDENTYQGNKIFLNGTDNRILRNMSVSGKNLTIELTAKYISGTYMLRSNAGGRTYMYSDDVVKGQPNSVRIIFSNLTDDVATRTLLFETNTSGSYFNAYYNGVGNKMTSFEDTQDGSYISIGSFLPNSTNQAASEFVYSVRVYNRALTDEEVKQNYNVDKYRFGSGA